MSGTPDPVTIQGLSLGGMLTAGGAWATFGVIATAFLRRGPLMKKLDIERDASLRSDLLGEIAKLRVELSDQRRKCDEEQLLLRREIDGLHRQIIAFQIGSGRAFPVGGTPESDKAVDRLIQRIDEGDQKP